MSQINFYSLGKQHDEQDGRLLIACRIADKAVGLGHRVYIWLDDDASSKRLDQLLWSFRPSSFLPHQLIGANDDAPVQLGVETPSPDFGEVLINLSSKVPDTTEGFAKINEIVGPDDASLEAGRQRYRHYRQTGLPLENIPL